jgi:hypothetical protein
MNHNAGTFRLVHPSDEFPEKSHIQHHKKHKQPLNPASDVQKIPCLKKN